MAYIIYLVLPTTGIIPNKLHDSLSINLFNLRPGLYIQMQRAVLLHTCHIVRNVFHRTVNKN